MTRIRTTDLTKRKPRDAQELPADNADTIKARKTAVDAAIALTQARADFANGQIDTVALQAAEDLHVSTKDELRTVVRGAVAAGRIAP